MKLPNKVIPGLSIKSGDLRRRLGSQTLTINQNGKSYTNDPKIVEALKMNNIDLARSYVKDAVKIGELTKQVQAEAKAKAEAAKEAEFAKIREQAIAETKAAMQKEASNG